MGKPFRIIHKIEILERWAGLAGGLAVILIMLIAVYSVVMRYILRTPTLWTLEVSEYLLVAAIFLAVGFVLQVEGHVGIDLLLLTLPRRSRLILDGVIASVIVVVFAGLFCYASARLAASYFGVPSDSTYKLPLFPSYVMIPIGSFLLLIQGCIRLIKNIHRLKSGDEEVGGN